MWKFQWKKNVSYKKEKKKRYTTYTSHAWICSGLNILISKLHLPFKKKKIQLGMAISSFVLYVECPTSQKYFKKNMSE